MKSVCLLFVVYFCLNCVEAGIFLKATDPYIHQDAVWLYSNATAITSIAPDVPPNKFTKSIVPLDNIPLAHIDGTTGVLYSREDSCSSEEVQQPIPLPFYSELKSCKVPRIALIKKQAGNCTVFEKILNAQVEGAIGVILYDAVYIDYSQATTEDRKKGVPSENNLKIPVYHVDHDVGKELYYQLEKMAGVPTAKIPTNEVDSNLTTRISVRIQLFPADNLRPTAWELTLLVMIVILGTSVLFSVAMHIYMWKKGKRLQETVERNRQTIPGNILPMGKPILTVARLYEFPTRTIDKLPDADERKKVETVLADEKQIEALIQTTALAQQKTRSFKTLFKKKTSQSPSDMIKMATPVNNMCVVCLEAFKIGDEVRKLPCNHEYHCICIDPWLTSKSGECPLCKYDCSVETKSGDGNTTSSKGIRHFFRKFKHDNKNNSVLPSHASQRLSVRMQSIQRQPMNTEAPPSPGLNADLRAIENTENNINRDTQQENTADVVSEIPPSQSWRSLVESNEQDAQTRLSVASTVFTIQPEGDDVFSDISLSLSHIDFNHVLDNHHQSS